MKNKVLSAVLSAKKQLNATGEEVAHFENLLANKLRNKGNSPRRLQLLSKLRVLKSFENPLLRDV